MLMRPWRNNVHFILFEAEARRLRFFSRRWIVCRATELIAEGFVIAAKSAVVCTLTDSP